MRQLLDKDATRRSMAAMASGCLRHLIKLDELADLSSCKGETPHWCSPRRLPHRQGLPREDSQEEAYIRLHLDEGLADGDKANDV